MLKTKEEYLESVKKEVNLYILGEKEKEFWTNPLIVPTINTIALTYELAQKPENRELMITKSNLTGEEINRFSHIHQSIEDLLLKIKMQRFIGQKCGTCFQRCAGWDLANALYSITFEVDKKYKTEYHKRFLIFWKEVQSKDLTVVGSLTDPKGDRSKKPSEQIDPDLHLHVIKRDDKGVYIKGAKMHLTGFLGAHYCVVMPTRAMGANEKDYAISFVIPTNQKGITLIYGRQSCDTRKLEEDLTDVGNFKYGAHESFVAFDNVFIPNEHIFLNGEMEFTGELVNRFAGFHRQSYGGCKPGVGDVIIGACALCAKQLGTYDKSNIKEKLTELIHLNENIYSCGIACSALGFKREAGNYEMNSLLANNCKLNVTKIPYKIVQIVQDICGGISCNMPSVRDLKGPITGPILRKYLVTCKDVKIEDRFKIIRFIESITQGLGSVSYLVESLHGAGSPQAQRMMIFKEGKLEEKIKLIKELLDIND